MSDNDDFQINHAHLELLEEELQQGKLYKIFMLSPLLEKYFHVDDPSTVTFLEGFLEYLNQAMHDQEILFAEDEPRKHHLFAQNDRVMVVMLVPPDLVFCINGNLVLKKNQLILESVLGVYLFNESDQFFTNSMFSAEKVKQWIIDRNSLPTPTIRESES